MTTAAKAKTGTHWRRIFALTVFGALMLAALAFANSGRAAIETPPPPSVWSDKADYAPGEQVNLSGANWAPGQSVHIRVNDDAGETWRRDVDVTADASGAISDQFNLPDWFVAQYSVTATGASSGTATWSFTDSNPGTITVTPASVTTAQGSPAGYTVSLAVGGNSNQCDVTLAASGLPTGASAAFATNPLVTTGAGSSPQTTSLTINTVATTPTGSYTITISGSRSGVGCQGPGATPGSATLAVTSGDTTAPTVSSINRLDASPTNTVGNVRWTVTFSENVTGVGAGDFGLVPSAGVTGSSITNVSGSGLSYTVTASTGTGNGTLGLNLVDDDSIVDAAANRLGGTGAGNGNVTGQTYTIDRSAPTVTAAAVQGDSPSFSGATAYTAGDWTDKDLRITFTCADTGGSGLTAGSGDQTQDFTAETSAATATFSGICADNAGNTASGATFGAIKIDKTAPVISDLGPTPASPNGNNGWYTSDVSNGFEATDATSGLSASCITSFPLASGHNRQSQTTSGEGSAVHVTSEACTDVAGNSASGKQSADFMIDKTDPSVTVSLARTPDHNGWYNHAVDYGVSASSDATSGIDNCDMDATYSGPDDSAASVSRSCTDAAGNTGSDLVAFQYDATDPSVSATPSRSPDHNGWYNHAFSASYSGTDDTSDIDECDAADSYSGPDTGSGLVSGSCTDNAGNSGAASYNFQYDTTNPTINATLTPAANGNGWNKTDVDVHFICNDNLSGIDPAYGCPADQTLTSEGLHTLHVATADDAGNVVTPSFDVRVDKTNPTISGSASPVANSYGWNNTSVAVSFSCADGLSGLDSCESDHVLSSEGAGQSVTGQAQDKAGNQATSTVSGINIDKTNPVVAVTGVSNGAVYTLGSVPAAGCSTSDALSGVKTTATLSSSGGPVGSITASCSGAEDKADNTNSASVTYTVTYNFTGFFAPVDNDPTCNVVKAGSAVPIKFSLHGYQGMSIFASGYPAVSAGTCAGFALDTVEETVTAGGSSLNYDSTSDQYIYVWKTDKAWAGKAMRFTVKLADATYHYARFTFTK